MTFVNKTNATHTAAAFIRQPVLNTPSVVETGVAQTSETTLLPVLSMLMWQNLRNMYSLLTPQARAFVVVFFLSFPSISFQIHPFDSLVHANWEKNVRTKFSLAEQAGPKTACNLFCTCDTRPHCFNRPSSKIRKDRTDSERGEETKWAKQFGP